MLSSRKQKAKSFRNIFKKSSKPTNDEALDASLMRNDRKMVASPMHFDEAQLEMLDKLYDYHRIDIDRLRHKFKKKYQFETFIRSNQENINDARTSNMIILGTSGSGKTKLWWNFLNYYRKSYLDANTWGLSPKDFYYIMTEKMMNISVDILIEYEYHKEKKQDAAAAPSTCLSKNDLVQWKPYELELDDEEVKEGYDFFADLISKLSKITAAINTNVELEENKKLQGQKPNWDKIQELRNIEKEMKEFKPSIAPKLKKLWKSKTLRDVFLYQYGLHNARNLFYFVDHIEKFVLQKQSKTEEKTQAKDDQSIASTTEMTNIKVKWEWEWAFEEILRCQIRTTGVIEQCLELGPFYQQDLEKSLSLKVRLWDVGGAQNERKKWKFILNLKQDTPDIECILFVVNLMSFYKKSWESDKNGLVQSLQLFCCLLSHGDATHVDQYHSLMPNTPQDTKLKDPIAFARQVSQEEYNICVDHQVKRAINDISLFYIIFTDTEGLEQMLKGGASFKECFDDYKGDNSVIDVQNFVEGKFRAIIDAANQRTKDKNKKLFRSNSPSDASEYGQNKYLPRTGSLKKINEMGPPAMRRIQTVPPSMRVCDQNEDEFNSDFELSDDGLMHNEPQPQIEGQKRLKCRFVSVIDHEEMKNVMNEIIQSSFMNKNALDPVLHSLIG
eukprot:82260_1